MSDRFTFTLKELFEGLRENGIGYIFGSCISRFVADLKCKRCNGKGVFLTNWCECLKLEIVEEKMSVSENLKKLV